MKVAVVLKHKSYHKKSEMQDSIFSLGFLAMKLLKKVVIFFMKLLKLTFRFLIEFYYKITLELSNSFMRRKSKYIDIEFFIRFSRQFNIQNFHSN